MKAGTTSRRIGLTLCVLLALAVAPIAAIAVDGPRSDGDPVLRGDRGAGAGNAELRGFGSCNSLGRYARRHSEAVSYPTGGFAEDTPMPTAPGVTGGDAADSGAGAGAAGDGSSGTTGTNVQEPGIDEPDIVKADGQRVFAIANGKLRAIDVTGAAPVELGAIDLAELPGNAAHGYDHQLLLAGDRLLLITQTDNAPSGGGGGDGIASDIAYYGSPRTVLSEIDVSDPAAMSVLRTMRLEGGYVDARMAGATARLVISTFPEYPFSDSPIAAGVDGVPAEGRVKSARKLIPNTVLRDEVTGQVERQRMIGCRALRRPKAFSGLEMLSVLTFDLGQGLEPTDVDTIMTQGDTVYGSADSLYVATQRWVAADATEEQVSGVNTEIHKFALGSEDETEYVASGAVPGFMLSQWALSEQDGFLRVASTRESPEFDFGERESFVTVLGEEGDKLEEVGSVGGLGRGESIYAVRFIGDVGYVVTFRQVDPLYTVDLSDPTDPKVVGELKVPGYSAYLHPAGEGLLLGVGQDATEQGRTQGTQVSLFDVNDLSAPSALDQVGFGQGSYSEVEYDHHAFLLYPPTGLAVIPLQDYGVNGQAFAGAVGLHVGATGIDEIARFEHPDSTVDGGGGTEPVPPQGVADDGGTQAQPSPVRRSLVTENRLYTLSDGGLMSHDLITLAEQGYLSFD